MALTPLLLLLNERVIQPRTGTRQSETRAPDAIDRRSPVLIAGFGGFGSTIGRLLNANGVKTTVLDHDSDRVDLLRRLGLQVFYGDATRHDLLLAAGAADADVLVLALDSPAKTLRLVDTVKRHFPHLRIVARAFDWADAHELQEAGVQFVYRSSLDTSLRAGSEVLGLLGFRAYQAHRAAQKFLRHDEESLRQLTEHRKDDRKVYLGLARQRIEELERMLLADLRDGGIERDMGWDPESLREEVSARG
jgi:voltage-gated potassium channel Kch